MSNYYSAGEILWLLSLTHDEAVSFDAAPNICLSDHSASSADDGGLPVVVRWNDVRRARERIKQRKGLDQIMFLRAIGHTEEEVASMMGVGRLVVHRRLRVGLRELVSELGAREEPDAIAVVAMCLINDCGQPRVRLRAVKRRVKGGWRTVKPEITAHTCIDHLRPDLQARAMV